MTARRRLLWTVKAKSGWSLKSYRWNLEPSGAQLFQLVPTTATLLSLSSTRNTTKHLPLQVVREEVHKAITTQKIKMTLVAEVPTVQPQPSVTSFRSASLYVGELDSTVTEDMLFGVFSAIGPISSIHVCRDRNTRRSLGYAYVNYLDPSDAERALEQLNYSSISNRVCRIMRCQRDPALRKTGQGNIFIKNLDMQMDSKALHDTFAPFGNVLSCKVATDEQGRSKGYGFIAYETADAAKTAIEAMNDILLNDRKVYVGHHISRKERQPKGDDMKAQFTNLYVKNLHASITEEEFEKMFSQFGSVTSAVIARDEVGKSKGFGFVNFETHNQALLAIESLHGTELGGKRLFVSRAQTKAEREVELRRFYEQEKTEVPQRNQIGMQQVAVTTIPGVFDGPLRYPPGPNGLPPPFMQQAAAAGSIPGGFDGPLCYPPGPNGLPPSFMQQAAEAGRFDGPFYHPPGLNGRPPHFMQQAAVAGIPDGFSGSLYYPPGPNGLPPHDLNMMGYGQPRMVPPRPRYPPTGSQVPGMPRSHHGVPQYGMPDHPHAPRGLGSSWTNPTTPIWSANVPSPANSAPHTGPFQRPPTAHPRRNRKAGRLNSETRNAAAPAPPPLVPIVPLEVAALVATVANEVLIRLYEGRPLGFNNTRWTG